MKNIFNQKFTYKQLTDVLFNMGESMKNNGECQLGVNSLLDRFAKGAKYNSRQQLKAIMSKDNQKAQGAVSEVEQEEAFNTIKERVVEYTLESTKFFLNAYKDKLMKVIEDGEEDLSDWMEGYMSRRYADISLDEEGFYFCEFCISKVPNEELMAFIDSYGELRIDSRFCGSMVELLEQLASEIIKGKSEHFVKGIVGDILTKIESEGRVDDAKAYLSIIEANVHSEL